MADIKDIDVISIKQLLRDNKVKISTDNDVNYENAFGLMQNENSIIRSRSIVNWIIAYNILQQYNFDIPNYNIKTVKNGLDDDIEILMDEFNIGNTDDLISILRYMHKLDENVYIGNMLINKDTNIYNIFPNPSNGRLVVVGLPKETWTQILLDVNCEDLDDLSDVSPQFRKLIDDNNIKELVKIRGFPRTNGRAKIVNVSKFRYVFENNDSMDILLSEMRKADFSPVRGDLIYFEKDENEYVNKLYIYDGCKIINLHYNERYDEDYLLPKEFTVITSGVPLDYWKIDKIDENKIDLSEIVWLDTTSIKDELFNNITAELDDIFTSFYHNDDKYTIYLTENNMYGVNADDINKNIFVKRFKKWLAAENVVPLYHDSDGVIWFNEPEHNL
jgi:hypothetical protein